MHKITPHIWYDTQAVEAARFYTSVFPDSKIRNTTVLYDTPSGDCDVVSFDLFGQPFMAISAGPLFACNPTVSFMVACKTIEEVDAFWAQLSEGGKVLMPLDSYPFSQRYGWTEDRYGVSWQIMHAGEREVGQRITVALMYTASVCGKAEEAVTFYTSVFPNSSIGDVVRYGKGEEPDKEGTVKFASFSLHGQNFAAMDSARVEESFNEAISLMVDCDSQEEVDRYWEALSAVPEAEQCGWLKDKFGLSWQIVPSRLGEILSTGSKEQIARVTEAFLPMKKFDIEVLEKALKGEEVEIGGQK